MKASLPIIWDADFLYGPCDRAGTDTYVLCEINASSCFATSRRGAGGIVTEVCPKWGRRPIIYIVDLLAAVPSVVYGLWALLAVAANARQHLPEHLGRDVGHPDHQGPHRVDPAATG